MYDDNANRYLVSVIIPVYNIIDYIQDCIQSIINQTYRNIEIIVVDDGSTDGSSQMCDDFRLIDERIRVYHKKNGGLSDARNFGLNTSTGEYVSFVDGDDMLHPQAIEILMNNIVRYSADISEGGVASDSLLTYENFINIKDNQCRCFDSKQATINMYLATGYLHVMSWGKIYRRSLFNDIEFPQGMLHEDMAIMYRLYQEAEIIVGTKSPIYYVKQREGSITRSEYSSFRIECWYKYYKEPLEYYKGKDELIYNAVCAGYIKDVIPYYKLAFDAGDLDNARILYKEAKRCCRIRSLCLLRPNSMFRSIMYIFYPRATFYF